MDTLKEDTYVIVCHVGAALCGALCIVIAALVLRYGL